MIIFEFDIVESDFQVDYVFIGVFISGVFGKYFGRVGDSVLLGGGFYVSRCFKFYKVICIMNFYE